MSFGSFLPFEFGKRSNDGTMATTTTSTSISTSSSIFNSTVETTKPYQFAFQLPTLTKDSPSTVNASSSASSLPSSGSILKRPVEALFEWEFPCLFFSKLTDSKQFFYSPRFLYSGCSWYLKLESSGWISLHLHSEASKESDRNIIVTFGLRMSDGAPLEEVVTQDKSASEDDFDQFNFGRQKLWDQNDPLGRQIRFSGQVFDIDLGFCITCRMRVGHSHAVESKKLKELETLSSNFRDLLKSKTNHDVTIKAKDKEFHAHRAVLSARSPVFAAMFEHNLSEKETGVVDVEDSDPESFGDFLEYVYTGRIEDLSFRSAYHLYVTAHKYEVKELKSYCVAHMRRNLAVKNVCDVVVMADQYDEVSLMDSAHAFFNRNTGKIVSTVEWETLMRKNHRLANKLLKEMVSAVEARGSNKLWS